MRSADGIRDPLLAYINTYLASHRSSASAPTPHPGSASGGSRGGVSSGSGTAAGLPTEADMWHLQWDELEVERQVGRGSFGAVYKARWRETAVAVKVLIDKGAQDPMGGSMDVCLLVPEVWV